MGDDTQKSVIDTPPTISRRRALYVPPAVVAVMVAKQRGFGSSGPVNHRGGNGKGRKNGHDKESGTNGTTKN